MAWNNGAVSCISEWTCLSAKSGPARRISDGEDLTVEGVKFQSRLGPEAISSCGNGPTAVHAVKGCIKLILDY